MKFGYDISACRSKNVCVTVLRNTNLLTLYSVSHVISILRMLNMVSYISMSSSLLTSTEAGIWPSSISTKTMKWWVALFSIYFMFWLRRIYTWFSPITINAKEMKIAETMSYGQYNHQICVIVLWMVAFKQEIGHDEILVIQRRFATLTYCGIWRERGQRWQMPWFCWMWRIWIPCSLLLWMSTLILTSSLKIWSDTNVKPQT